MMVKIVCIGGGTGLSTLLRGLKNYDIDIVAIVTTMDDGGSSGRLMKEFGTLPPGDIRNCILALAEKEDALTKVFNYRFPVKIRPPQVGGHSLGNLLIVALADLYGFDGAIEKISEVFSVKGKILPITLQPAQLVAVLEDGTIRYGETNVSTSKSPIKRLLLNPKRVIHHKNVIEEIRSADAIVIGPGSLFTSILPNLLVGDVTDTISKSKAEKIYVCNIMTQPGETDGFDVEKHIETIYEHVNGKFKFDWIVLNSSKIPEKICKKYRAQKSYPVKVRDIKYLKSLARKGIVKAKLLDASSKSKFARHDPKRLAEEIIKLLRGRPD
jgi:uncharacterized cofD-like protein